MGVVHELRGVVLLEQVDYLRRGNLLGVEKGVDTQVGEYDPVVVLLILLVVDACRNFLGSQLLGECCGYDVDVLLGIGIDGYEQIRTPGTGFHQGVDGCRMSLYRDYIRVTVDLLQTFLVF